MRKINFAPGGYYHIYARTILGAEEFKNYKNADRLARNFILANSTKSREAFHYLRNADAASLEKAIEIAQTGEKLVDVLCYAIMPNHYHLLLRERKENGIRNFIHKCNTAIAKYINIKNNRLGPLFESRFNAKHVDKNEYLLHLSLYIHLNPLDFINGKGWREGNCKRWNIAKNKLINYPYSSLKSFLDNKHADMIISGTEIIKEQFNDRKEYELFLRDWAKSTPGVDL